MTMLEKMARAISDVSDRRYVPGIPEARAALQALREPDHLKRLAEDTFADGDDPAYVEDFVAMIDHILSVDQS